MHSLPRELQDIFEKLLVLACELVGVLNWIALGKTYLSRPRSKYIASCSLNRVASQHAPLLFAQLLHIDILKSVVQQAQQRAEASLDSTVRHCPEKQNVSGSVFCDFMDKLMALLLLTGADSTRLSSRMRLIHYHEEPA